MVIKLCKPAIVYKIAPSGNSELAGRKIVRVASVGDKNAFAGICTLSEYFPSSIIIILYMSVCVLWRFSMATVEELQRHCDDCAICWEKMESARKLPCGHIFHK